MKFAVISDIHGNFPALEAVLADAASQGAEGYLILGDYGISAPWPDRVTDRLMSLENAHIVRGNEERYLRIPEGDDGQFEVTRWCRQTLGKERCDWLWELPERLDVTCEGVKLHMAHSTEVLLGAKIGAGLIGPTGHARRYPEGIIPHDVILQGIRKVLRSDEGFLQARENLPGGVYLFGHTHTQWHLQDGDCLFVNPGSCGLALDCSSPGAPYTLLTVANGSFSVEERHVPLDAEALIEQAKQTTQYKAARIWSEIVFEEWRICRERISLFLRFAERYATSVGDERRPFVKETWNAAYDAWRAQKDCFGGLPDEKE